VYGTDVVEEDGPESGKRRPAGSTRGRTLGEGRKPRGQARERSTGVRLLHGCQQAIAFGTVAKWRAGHRTMDWRRCLVVK
jgi:hypothetical protein